MAGRRALLVFAWDQPEDAMGEDFLAVLDAVRPVLEPGTIPDVVGNPHVTAAIGPTAEAVEAALTGAGVASISSSGEGDNDEGSTE